MRIVYDDIGGHAAFAAWSREHPGEFYRIASRLILSEVNVRAEQSLTVLVDRGCGNFETILQRTTLPALTELPDVIKS